MLLQSHQQSEPPKRPRVAHLAAFALCALAVAQLSKPGETAQWSRLASAAQETKVLTEDQKAAFSDYDPKYRAAKLVEISDSSENVLPPGCDYSKNQLDYSKQYDTCVIGAGLSGTVFAERTANQLGRNVLVIDSRPHIGGNCYDFIDQKTGILRNQYGSHLFHTKIKRVWDYVTSNPKAPLWKPWYHQKFGRIDGSLYKGMRNGTYYVPIPVNILTVNRLFGLNIQTTDEMSEWLKQVQIPCDGECKNAEEMAKSRVGEALYEAVFETYTIKQWNRSPKDMNASVTARIPVRADFDPRYFDDKWQALPAKGYTAWFEAMLDHPLIDVVLNTDFFNHQKHLEGSACKSIIYTGPVDRYFADQGLEKLQYRSITFTEERHYHTPGYILPTPVLNYPGPETPYTRAIEYKHYLHQASPHSIVVKETTSDEGEPYYPIPNPRNLQLYQTYQKMAAQLEEKGKFVFVGRLANYKYFDMDKAINNALQLFDEHAIKTADRPKYKSTTPTKTAMSVTSSASSFVDYFRGSEFEDYKTRINDKIEARRLQRKAEYDNQGFFQRWSASCGHPLYQGEFGMEMRSMVPWAYYKTNHGCLQLKTQGLTGSKYMYWFSDHHTVVPLLKRRFTDPMYKDGPFPDGVYVVEEIPEDAPWQAPPFKQFFFRPEVASLPQLQSKPLVVVQNKYNTEWGMQPKNYFSQEMLKEMLAYLTPKYTIVYKRHTSKKLRDKSSEWLDLGEKDFIRREYPEVILLEDIWGDKELDPEDHNLLLFGLMSLSERFLTVMGGMAVLSSWFGGTNTVLMKRGHDSSYNYFHRFSNASVVRTGTDQEFLDHMKSIM